MERISFRAGTGLRLRRRFAVGPVARQRAGPCPAAAANFYQALLMQCAHARKALHSMRTSSPHRAQAAPTVRDRVGPHGPRGRVSERAQAADRKPHGPCELLRPRGGPVCLACGARTGRLSAHVL